MVGHSIAPAARPLQSLLCHKQLKKRRSKEKEGLAIGLPVRLAKRNGTPLAAQMPALAAKSQRIISARRGSLGLWVLQDPPPVWPPGPQALASKVPRLCTSQASSTLHLTH